ncbi:MAG: hypothetical protein PHS95_00525 [Candidatus Pacebacteria bacterium]|nr:hypothetical protein [Candidatus Paceibacterota bacterium]
MNTSRNGNNKIKEESKIERMSDGATKWIGSTSSLVIHTVFFVAIFFLILLGCGLDRILLFLTTVVSLEAIYLSIFIQMAVNKNTRQLHEVSRDIDDIQEDVEDISEDIDEIQEDVEDISEED